MVVYIQVLKCTPPLNFSPQWVCSHLFHNGVVYLSMGLLEQNLQQKIHSIYVFRNKNLKNYEHLPNTFEAPGKLSPMKKSALQIREFA